MPSYLHVVNEYLTHHPMIGLVFTFVVAMIESIAILGTLIPGAVTMTAVGVLVGSGVLPLSVTLLVSIVGALTGDFLSYWFGLRYRDHIYQMWPFKKYQKFMRMGEKFFEKHGGKSVVIGRFVGPVRSMVPLIAGLLQMRPLPFICAAIISATSWSVVYMFPGIFLGALSMELPAGKAAKFLGYALLWIFLAWIAIWMIHYLIRKSWKYIDAFLGICWRYLKAHPKGGYLLSFIVNPKDPHDHRLLTLLFLGFLSLLLFTWIAESVYVHGLLTELDLPLFNLLQSFRSPHLDTFMMSISFLGEHLPLAIAAGIIGLVLLYRRAFWMAFHWAGLTAFVFLSCKALKWLIHAKRPDIYPGSDIFSSFPSGHVSISFALFGFSAVLIASELTAKGRRIPYFLAGILVFLIALSRIYLGAHWLSDVMGAFFFSFTCILFATVSYRRRLSHFLSAQFLVALLPTALLSCCLLNGILHKKDLEKNAISHSQFKPLFMTRNKWEENKSDFPLYRNSRFGKPIQPLNIFWLGNVESIRQHLIKKGWKDEHADDNDLKAKVLKNLVTSEEDYKLPMLATLYHNKPPVLIMTKRQDKGWVVLELWESDIQIEKAKSPLLLGAVHRPSHPHKWLALHHKKPYFKGAIDSLLPDITTIAHWKIEKIEASRFPQRLKKLLLENSLPVAHIEMKSS